MISWDDMTTATTEQMAEEIEEVQYILSNLTYDSVNHRLDACYEDEYYTIYFGTEVNDYGVREAPVYSAVFDYHTSTRNHFGGDWSATYNFYELEAVAYDVDVAPFEEALAAFDDDSNYSFSYFKTDNESIENVCVVRSLLNGLPMGEAKYLRTQIRRARYGNYFGSINLAATSNDNIYISKRNAISVVNYACSDLTETNDIVTVTPLMDCISNAIPRIVSYAYSLGCGEVNVYYAELIYAPLTIGSESDGYGPVYNPDIRFVPVWVLYLDFANGDNGSFGNVYLSALTGEVIESVPM